MATTDLTQASAFPAHQGRLIHKVTNVLDFSANNAAVDDVFQMVDVPAKTHVLGVLIDVETAEGGAGAIDVGDGSDADGFHDGLDVNSTGDTMSALALTEAAPNTVTGYSNGKYYAAADTIDITAKAILDAAKVFITVLMVDMSPVFTEPQAA